MSMPFKVPLFIQFIFSMIVKFNCSVTGFSSVISNQITIVHRASQFRHRRQLFEGITYL